MKQFADLHLQPNLNNKEQTNKLIHTASNLNYSLIGISIPPKTQQDTIQFLQKTCKNHNIDFATRIDLTPKTPHELLKNLRQHRRKFELVAVNCLSKSVARQAAKDHRVDLLVFPSTKPRQRFFDTAEARLASQSVAALEINMTLLLQSTGFSRAQLLSSLQKEVATAEKFGVPIVICSGAANYLQLREPNDLASLAALFEMEGTAALKAVSTVPLGIVERNREKLDSSYVAEGIRVVRRGVDCGV